MRFSTGSFKTPVLILRSGRHGALGLARSLGRLGVPVFAVDSDPRMLAFASRYCREGFVWDFDRASPRETVGYLLEIGRKIGTPAILIPTTDAAALFTAKYGGALQGQFNFPAIPHELADALCSKKKMCLLAERAGVPTPKTVFPASLQDVVAFAAEAAFPVIIKPIEADKAKDEAGRQKVVVFGKKELIQKYGLLEDPDQPNLMLQEFIPGGDEASWMFNGYFDRNSTCQFGMTGRKIRQYRPYAGITSLGLCDINEDVAKITAHFMSAIRYRGILDIGYRYDARDGRYKVFDVNPRIGCTFRLFVTQNGMDVARAMYLDLCGEPIAAGEAQPGRKWIVDDLDIASAFLYWRDGELSLWKWVKSLGGIRESAMFASDDLRPVWRVLVHDVRWALRLRARAQIEPRERWAQLEEGFRD